MLRTLSLRIDRTVVARARLRSSASRLVALLGRGGRNAEGILYYSCTGGIADAEVDGELYYTSLYYDITYSNILLQYNITYYTKSPLGDPAAGPSPHCLPRSLASDKRRQAASVGKLRQSGISSVRFIHSSNQIPCSSNVFACCV